MREKNTSPAAVDQVSLDIFADMYAPDIDIEDPRRLNLAIQMWDRLCNETVNGTLRLSTDADVAAFVSGAVTATASLAGVRHNIDSKEREETIKTIGQTMRQAIPRKALKHARKVAEATTVEIHRQMETHAKQIPFGAIPERQNVIHACKSVVAFLPEVSPAQKLTDKFSELDHKKIAAAGAAAATFAIAAVNNTALAVAETTNGGTATNGAETSQVASQEKAASTAANQAMQNFPAVQQSTEPEQATGSNQTYNGSNKETAQKPAPGSQITVIAASTAPASETTPSQSTAPTSTATSTPTSPETTDPTPSSPEITPASVSTTPNTTPTPVPSATETPVQGTDAPQPEQNAVPQQPLVEKLVDGISKALDVAQANRAIISGLAPKGLAEVVGNDASNPSLSLSRANLADTSTERTIWGSDQAPPAVMDLLQSPNVQAGQEAAAKNVERIFAFSALAMPGVSIDNGGHNSDPGSSNTGSENVDLTKVRDAAFMDRVKDLRQQSGTPLSADTLYKLFTDADKKYNHPVINRELIMSMAYRESLLGKLRYPSSAGARGMVQFMKGTWKEWGKGKNVMNNEANVDASFRYMIYLYKWTGNAFPNANEGLRVKLALSAYNWGMGNVGNLGRLPTLKESSSRGYADAIYNSAQKTIKHIQNAVRQAKENNTSSNNSDKLPSEFTSALKKEIASANRTNAEKTLMKQTVATAVKFADSYPYTVKQRSFLKGDSDFRKAIKNFATIFKKSGFNLEAGKVFGAPQYDCKVFVDTVAWTIGDDGFGTDGHGNRLNTTGLFNQILRTGKTGGKLAVDYKMNPSMDSLQPGDMLLARGHIFIWTGPIEGKGGKIYQSIESARGSSRVPSFSNGKMTYDWIKGYGSGNGGFMRIRYAVSDSNSTSMN